MRNDRPQRIEYVLDTDATSALQRRHEAIRRRVAAAGPRAVAPTVVTLYEQIRGRLAVINRARDETNLQRAFQSLMDTRQYFCANDVLPFDRAAAGIYRSLVAQRLRIGTNDLRIAAITLANDAILVTSNRRDFERVPGLRIEDWTVG